MSNIYILDIRYNNTIGSGDLEDGINSTSHFRLRVGYFGLCARRSDETQWLCASGRTGIQTVIVDTNVDPLATTDIGAHFKDDVLFSGLL